MLWLGAGNFAPMLHPTAVTASPYAAVFIDFENIYYFIKNHYLDPQDTHDTAVELVRQLRDTLKTQLSLDTLVMDAYADFERIPAGPQGPLYLLGVKTINVLGTEHKNAADMQLCIDAMSVLYTRPDIGTFVLVAGDRDYIPVLQHLRRQARQIKVVGFRESVSGDLLQMLGAEHFIDARELLAPGRLEGLERHRQGRLAKAEEIRLLRERGTMGVKTVAAQQAERDAGGLPIPPAALPPAGTATPAPVPLLRDENGVFRAAPRFVPPAPRAASLLDQLMEEPPVPFAPLRRLTRDTERRCLGLILEEMQRRHTAEVWLSPFLRRLTDVLPELPYYERSQLVNGLRDAGAVRVEKRNGEPHPFSVIVANYNHPDVQALNPGDE